MPSVNETKREKGGAEEGGNEEFVALLMKQAEEVEL